MTAASGRRDRPAGWGADAVSDETGARPFARVWLPSFLVFFACGLVLFSLNFWVTHSAGGATLGVIVGVANIASVITVVLCSGVIDRTDRQRFAVRTKAVLALAFVLLLAPYLAGVSPVTLLAAAACYLLVECAYAVYMATIETTVADLAPRSWSSRRTASLLQLQPQVERAVAPLAGSALIAAGLLAWVPALALSWVGVTVAFSRRYRAAFALAQPAPRPAPGPAPPARRSGRLDPLRLLGTTAADVAASVRWIRRDPLLVYLIVVGVAVNLVLFPFYVLMPAYLAEFEGLSTGRQALLYGQAATAYGIGMLTSTALLAGFAKRSRHPAAYASACTAAVCALLWVLSTSPPAAVVPVMGALGVVFVLLAAVAGGGWLERTPAHMRARVFSVRRLVVFSSIPLGTSLMGFGGALRGYFPFLRALLVVVAVTTLAALAGYVVATRRRRPPGRPPRHEQEAGDASDP